MVHVLGCDVSHSCHSSGGARSFVLQNVQRLAVCFFVHLLTYFSVPINLGITSQDLTRLSSSFHECAVYCHTTSEGTDLVVQLLVMIDQWAQPDPAFINLSSVIKDCNMII